MASIVWGINYSISEKVLNKISPYSLMFFELLIGTLIAGVLCLNYIKEDIKNISEIKYLFAGSILMFNLGYLLIAFSIKNSNATIAGLIEISYPLFIILFSYLFFNEVNINKYTLIGGGLVMSGILVISFNDK